MIGTTLSHYRITEKLGQGGMGVVYRAEDSHLDRQVAIKVLPDMFAGDPERMARFEREAKLLASLNHSNIAAIYGLEEAEGKRFLVLELVEGETLAERIIKGQLPVDEALEVCREIAEGLEAAHEKGIIHRDLKPPNVKITPEGKVKILDFGLAKAFQAGPSAEEITQSPTISEMTRPGVILGTAAYMSPEQARGKLVDKRADIWAFGCILFECLTGKRAFQGETITEIVASILKSEPDWQALPAAASWKVRDLLHRCLQKEPRQRFHDIADARIEMEEARTGPSDSATVPSDTPGYRRRALVLSIGMLVLGAAVAALAVWYLKPQPPPVAQSPAHVTIPLPSGDQLGAGNYPRIALSPDGSRLVYAAIHSGVQQLFVRPLNSQDAKPLAGTEGAESAFFSPDGQWIGFFAGRKLKKVSIGGGAAQTLCDSGANGGAAWANDDTIIFSPSPTSGLLRVSAAGGKPEVLTTLDRANEEISHRWPQLMPGGKALLFTIATSVGNEFHIAVMRLDTRERHIVLRGGNTGRFVPTGHLIYSREGTLLAVRFDPVRLEVTNDVPETIVEGVTQSGNASGAEYSFSAAGLLAYIPAGPQRSERQIVWVDRKGVVEPLQVPPRRYGNVSLSPDGRRAAVVIGSELRETWIYDFERGTMTRLTTEGGGSSWPIWNIDGKRITYRGDRAGFRNVFWKAADGTGAEEQLTRSENAQIPTSWSPDGKWLAFSETSPTTGSDIWMLRLDGDRKQEPFLKTPFSEGRAVFSPDGRWLAYQSNESSRPEIYVQPFPGPGPKHPISTEGGEAPLWAHSGRELFYRSGNKMMAVDIKTEPSFTPGKSRLLFEGPFSQFGHDVSRDDQRFLMTQAVEPEQPVTQINLVLNWFEELKRLVPAGK